MFKNCMPLALIVLLLTSCSSVNNLFDSKSSAISNTAANAVQRNTMIGYTNFTESTNWTFKQAVSVSSNAVDAPREVTIGSHSMPTKLMEITTAALESFIPMQFKYAIMMNETVEKITNVSLYKVIDQWFGTRYRYGGTTHHGIDCSAFMQVIGQCVFGWILPRTAHEQYAVMNRVDRSDIQEGDFVFFHTRGRGVSHVGMCLQNNKFIHSCTSKGVMISDLDDSYWDSKIVAFKRMKEEPLFTN